MARSLATISVRQLALELKVDPRLVRGIVIGLGLELDRTPAADLLSRADADRVRQRYTLYLKGIEFD